MDIKMEGVTAYEEGNGLIFQSEKPLYILANRENYDFKYENKINNHYYNNPSLKRVLVERNGIAVVTTVEEIQGKFFTNITVLLDTTLDNLTLMNLFRTVIETISTTSWDVDALNKNRLDNELGNFYNTIFVACRLKSDVALPFDISLFYEVKEIVEEALRESFKALGYPRNIVKYLADSKISLDDIEKIAMDLSNKDETIIQNNFRNQLIHNLEDINIIAYIVEIIRLEEDYKHQRIADIDFDTNSVEHISEFMGSIIAKQIAGVDALSNFKKYNENTSEILNNLEPFTRSIVLGLIAGCITNL